MNHSILRVALSIAALSVSLPEMASAQQKLYPEISQRGNTRLFYWGTTRQQNYSVGHCTLNYGQPAWNAKIDAALAKKSFRRWRLGRNHWTTLDCDVPLQFGFTRVPAGHYFVVLDRRGQQFGLVLLEPSRVRAMRLDSYQAHRTVGGTFLPLKHTTAQPVVSPLRMAFQKTGADEASFTMSFGAHRLTTNFRLLKQEPAARVLPDPGVSVSKTARFILENAKELELFALEPVADKAQGFCDWKIRSRARCLDPRQQKALLTPIYAAIAAGGDPAKCFNPRHGIRAQLGHLRVDLVVCFECSQFHLYRESGPALEATLSAKARLAVQAVFDRAGLGKAKKPAARKKK